MSPLRLGLKIFTSVLHALSRCLMEITHVSYPVIYPTGRTPWQGAEGSLLPTANKELNLDNNHVSKKVNLLQASHATTTDPVSTLTVDL